MADETITATENYQIVQKIATDEYLKLHPETNAAIVKMAAEEVWSLGEHEAETVEEALELLRQAVEKIFDDGIVTGIKGAGEDKYRTGLVEITPENLGADKDPTENSKNLMTSGAIYETFKEYIDRTVSDFENYYTKKQIDSIYVGLQQLNIKILKSKDELPATWEDEDGDGGKETPTPTEDAVAYTFYLYPDETDKDGDGEVNDRHIYTMWYCGPVGHGEKVGKDAPLEFVYMGESKWDLAGYITDDDLKDALDEYDKEIKDYISEKLQETLDKAEDDLTELEEKLYGNGVEGEGAVVGDIPTLQEDVKAAQTTADTIKKRLRDKTKAAAYTAVAVNKAGVVIAGGHSIIVEDNGVEGAPTLDDLAIGGIAFVKVKEG